MTQEYGVDDVVEDRTQSLQGLTFNLLFSYTLSLCTTCSVFKQTAVLNQYLYFEVMRDFQIKHEGFYWQCMSTLKAL